MKKKDKQVKLLKRFQDLEKEYFVLFSEEKDENDCQSFQSMFIFSWFLPFTTWNITGDRAVNRHCSRDSWRNWKWEKQDVHQACQVKRVLMKMILEYSSSSLFTVEQSIQAKLHRFTLHISFIIPNRFLKNRFSSRITTTGNRSDPESSKSHFRFFSSSDFRFYHWSMRNNWARQVAFILQCDLSACF